MPFAPVCRYSINEAMLSGRAGVVKTLQVEVGKAININFVVENGPKDSHQVRVNAVVAL